MRAGALAVVALIGCAGDDSAPGGDKGRSEPDDPVSTTDSSTTAGTFEVAIVDPPPHSRAPLAKMLEVSASEPVRATVVIDDGNGHVRDVSPPHEGTAFSAPLVGFRVQRSYDVAVTLRRVSDDAVVLEETRSTSTPAPPVPFPDLELVSSAPGSFEGDTLFPARIPNSSGGTFLILADHEGEIVWALQSDGVFRDARVLDDGTVLALEQDDIIWTDWADSARVTLAPEADLGQYHHEVMPRPGGGFFVIASLTVTVPDLPTDAEHACEPGEEALVYDSLVVEVEPDGTEVGRWFMTDVLDTHRIGMDSLNVPPVPDSKEPPGVDWVHVNGIDYIEASDTFVVSARHQDAVVFVHRTAGTLSAILANPDGWGPAFEPMRLQPVGELQWPYHQHAPEVATEDGITGTVLMFDNGNDQRTPCGSESGFPIESRVVEYAFDLAAGTVEQLWEFRYGLPYFSWKLGDADRLPSGTVLGTWGNVSRDLDGTELSELGYGNTASRLVEFDPATGEVVWDLLLHEATRAETGLGWETTRVERVASPWPDGATGALPGQ